MIGAKPEEQATYAAATYADDDDDAAGDDDSDTFETETSTLTEVTLHTLLIIVTTMKRHPTQVAIGVQACNCETLQNLLCCVMQQEQELLTGELEPIAQSEPTDPQTAPMALLDDDDAAPEAEGALPS